MNLTEIARTLELEPLTPQVAPDPAAQVTAGYVSDLLSDVLANGPSGGVLVTIQVHMNVIAVAVHAEMAAVIFASGRTPDDAVCAKAAEAGIALYVSKASAFEIVGRLHGLGLRGPLA
jgi:hypothetical protein